MHIWLNLHTCTICICTKATSLLWIINNNAEEVFSQYRMCRYKVLYVEQKCNKDRKVKLFWYSLPVPAGGWTGATEVRKVVHTHSLSQPGPFWSLISPIRADLVWTPFWKNLPRTSCPPPPRVHQRNAKSCENRENWLQLPGSGHENCVA